MKSAIIEAAEVIEETAASLRKNFGAILSTGKFVCFGTEAREEYRRLKKLAQRLRAEASGWQPIETAPKDNKRPLYLARFSEEGELLELDWDGTWNCGSESWESPEICYYWSSNNGIEEPTHWMLPPAPPTQESEND